MSNDFYFEEHKPNRGGKGWFYTAIILIAFLVGALFVQFILPTLTDNNGRTDLSNNIQATATATAEPTAAPQSAALSTSQPDQSIERPDTAPELGGKVAMLANGNISDIVKTVGSAVVGVSNKVAFNNSADEQEQGYGSGVIISEDGYIVTNNHVIAGASSVSVILSNGIETDAVVVGADEYTDLAVLKIEADNLTVMPFGDSDKAQVGDLAIAIGNPLGRDYAGSVTAGIISGKDRQVTIDGRTIVMLQTDAAINPGNSGGALLNSDGELIGINSVKSTYTSSGISVEGLGFAIPINSAKPIIEELITEGHIKRPMIGVRGGEITAAAAQYYNIPQGFLVKEIVEGGPADKAGMQINDIILNVDGERTETMDEMSSIIYDHQPGDQITITVWREGKEIDLKVILGES